MRSWRDSGGRDVLGARTLRPLTRLKRNRLTLPKVIEPDAVTGRTVEEVLVPVRCRYESKTFVANQPLDRT